MSGDPAARVPEVDAGTGKARVEAGAFLLDVRAPGEWVAGHAEGATWIPMQEIIDRHHELPRDEEIVVICRSGGRSAQVTQALRARGFDAVNLAGGSQAWAAAGFPIVTDDGEPGTVV